MPIAYPVELRKKVVDAILDGESASSVADRFGLSVPTVRRWLRRHRSGEGLEPRPIPGKAPSMTTPEIVDFIKGFAESNPDASRDDMAEAVHARFGVQPSLGSVQRALRKAGLRRQRPVVRGSRVEPPKDPTTRYRPRHRREPRGQAYPSSLTDHEWALLRPTFEPATPRPGRPRVHSAREELDAVLYVLRSGCSWRMLPAHFPPWQTVYAAFRSWDRQGLFETAYDLLRAEARRRAGRAVAPTAAIIDSQSSRTTEKGGLAATMEPRSS